MRSRLTRRKRSQSDAAITFELQSFEYLRTGESDVLLRLKGAWDGQRRELAQVQADLGRLGADQDRIRKNLRETPREAEVYQTYLKKLSDQEKEIDTLTAKQKKLMGDEFAAKKAFENYLTALTD